MRTYAAVIERDPDTGWYVGYIPGWPGAHSQGATLDELHENLQEVVELLLEGGDAESNSGFAGFEGVAGDGEYATANGSNS